MAAPQPNFIALSQHLLGASQELALIPNVPILNVQQLLLQLIAQVGQFQNQMGQWQNEIQVQLGHL